MYRRLFYCILLVESECVSKCVFCIEKHRFMSKNTYSLFCLYEINDYICINPMKIDDMNQQYLHILLAGIIILLTGSMGSECRIY